MDLLLHGGFTPPNAQISQWRDWNTVYSLEIPDGEFARIALSIPPWPLWTSEPLMTVVLTYCFIDPVIELRRYCVMISKQHGMCVDEMISFKPEVVKWPEGYKNTVGFKWEVIDLGANRGSSTDEVRGQVSQLPGAGVLAAAALNPQWVGSSLDQGDVPSVIIPGYELSIVPEREVRDAAPLLSFKHDTDQVRLAVMSSVISDSELAVPVYVL